MNSVESKVKYVRTINDFDSLNKNEIFRIAYNSGDFDREMIYLGKDERTMGFFGIPVTKKVPIALDSQTKWKNYVSEKITEEIVENEIWQIANRNENTWGVTAQHRILPKEDNYQKYKSIIDEATKK